jgi:hypothetical protein
MLCERIQPASQDSALFFATPAVEVFAATTMPDCRSTALPGFAKASSMPSRSKGR